MGDFFHSLFVPLVAAMAAVLTAIHSVIPSYGWSLIVLALVVRLALWPLSQQQFKSMAEMQKLQPLVKALQAKHKGDPQKLNTETMALYKEHGVNPLAGCLPVVLQLPILIALYWAINERIGQFSDEHFAWIGTALSHAYPQVLATSLAGSDIVLLALYVISMYLSVRYGSPPSSDAQQAQTQKIMAFMSPAMIAFIGLKYHWASALILYWLSINVFTMGQQLILYRKYGLIGPQAALARAAAVEAAASAKNVTPAKANGKNAPDGKAKSPAKSPNGRAYRRGAKR
ncbi:MAG: YidC/Oxa1 family membrane protein insertase [Candidatus Velthaea sp.]